MPTSKAVPYPGGRINSGAVAARAVASVAARATASAAAGAGRRIAATNMAHVSTWAGSLARVKQNHTGGGAFKINPPNKSSRTTSEVVGACIASFRLRPFCLHDFCTILITGAPNINISQHCFFRSLHSFTIIINSKVITYPKIVLYIRFVFG